MTNMWCDDTVWCDSVLSSPPATSPSPHVSVSTVSSLTCFEAMIAPALRALMSKRVGVDEQGMCIVDECSPVRVYVCMCISESNSVFVSDSNHMREGGRAR